MRLLLLLSSLLCLLLGAKAPVFAEDLDFKEFTSQEGRFTVEFPGKPVSQVRTLRDGTKQFEFLRPVSKELVFMVEYFDVPEKYVAGKDPQERIKTFISGARKGKILTDEKELVHGKSKLPGREYRVEAEPGFFVRERTILDRARIYTIYVGAEDKAALDSKSAVRFFDSFQITPSGVSGAWQVEKYVFDGRPVDGGLDRVVQINEDKGEILFKESPRQVPGESVIPGGVVSVYTFTMDAASSPPQIDLKPKNTKLDGDKVSLGIFRVQKGRLELCIASPGADRPTDFSSEAGSRSEYYNCVSEKKVKQP